MGALSTSILETRKIAPVVIPVHPLPPVQPVTVNGLGLAGGDATPKAPSIPIDHLHWIDPVLANALNHKFATPTPVPKDDLPPDTWIPLSTPIGLATQFHRANDATQVYYLPEFAVWTNNGAVGVRFAAVTGTQGWR